MTEPAKPTSPTVSIVLSTYNRNPQLSRTLDSIRRQTACPATPACELIVVDDGTSPDSAETELLSLAASARYLHCLRPPSAQFRNPSLPNNLGIRAARGEVVLLQNAECLHRDPDTIQKLVAPVLAAPPDPAAAPVAVFAHVVALSPDGSPLQDYCSPVNPRPYFFCGAIRRELLVRIRGFDEDYDGAGYDDDDLADRLAGEGVQFLYLDSPLVHHQWHAPAGDYSSASAMHALYQSKLAAMLAGELGTVRNLGRTWGGQP